MPTWFDPGKCVSFYYNGGKRFGRKRTVYLIKYKDGVWTTFDLEVDNIRNYKINTDIMTFEQAHADVDGPSLEQYSIEIIPTPKEIAQNKIITIYVQDGFSYFVDTTNNKILFYKKIQKPLTTVDDNSITMYDDEDRGIRINFNLQTKSFTVQTLFHDEPIAVFTDPDLITFIKLIKDYFM